jgi:hypothetical protein
MFKGIKKFKHLNNSNLFNKFICLNNKHQIGNDSYFIQNNLFGLTIIKREYAKKDGKEKKQPKSKEPSKKQTKKEMLQKIKDKEGGSDDEGRDDEKSIEILEKMVGWTPRVDTRPKKQKEHDAKKVEEWRVLLRAQHNNMLRKEYRKWRMMRSGYLNFFIFKFFLIDISNNLFSLLYTLFKPSKFISNFK